jgi:hypothetical protein
LGLTTMFLFIAGNPAITFRSGRMEANWHRAGCTRCPAAACLSPRISGAGPKVRSRTPQLGQPEIREGGRRVKKAGCLRSSSQEKAAFVLSALDLVDAIFQVCQGGEDVVKGDGFREIHVAHRLVISPQGRQSRCWRDDAKGPRLCEVVVCPRTAKELPVRIENIVSRPESAAKAFVGAGVVSPTGAGSLIAFRRGGKWEYGRRFFLPGADAPCARHDARLCHAPLPAYATRV